MTPVTVALWSVLALLCLPVLAVAILRWHAATGLIYGACLAICLLLFAVALTHLVEAGNAPSTLRLSAGLPWIGAHFRMDALSAFFLVVTNLGGAGQVFLPSAMACTSKPPDGSCLSMLRFWPA